MPSRLLRACVRVLLPLIAVAAGVGSAAAASAATPIGPNRYFDGVVNAATTNPVIQMGCFSPAVPGQTGQPLPGQYVLVRQVLQPTSMSVGQP